jgi:hypothetical protein
MWQDVAPGRIQQQKVLTGLMAGTPIRRARRLEREQRAASLTLIPWDRWRALSDADKIQAIAGFNLDDMLALSSVPWDRADIHERHAKVNIFLAFLKAGYQASRDRLRQAELAQILDSVDSALRAHTATAAHATEGGDERNTVDGALRTHAQPLPPDDATNAGVSAAPSPSGD